jgi:hypothetical protein
LGITIVLAQNINHEKTKSKRFVDGMSILVHCINLLIICVTDSQEQERKLEEILFGKQIKVDETIENEQYSEVSWITFIFQ